MLCPPRSKAVIVRFDDLVLPGASSRLWIEQAGADRARLATGRSLTLGPSRSSQSCYDPGNNETNRMVSMLSSRSTLCGSNYRLLPLLALVVLLLPAGTTKMYAGPELPKAEIAVIDGIAQEGTSMLSSVLIIPLPSGQHQTIMEFASWQHQTLIMEIDGEAVSEAFIQVLPGLHRVKLFYTYRPEFTFCEELGGCIGEEDYDLEIAFTAEAGHEYRIPAEWRGGRNWVWVEDKTTGAVVAGERPPPED